MEKINFEAGELVSPAKVTIDNVDHEVTPAVWEGNTPLSPFVLNKMQSNIENAISESGVIVSAVEPTGANREKIWVQHSNNIVDKSLAIDNRYVWFNNNAEAISSNNNYWSTGRLQVKPNTTYYFNKNINYIVYYNNSGTAVRMETDKSSFITGSNEYYVQLSFAKSKVEYNSNIMISTIENASYEPYVEPKMYCLNDNNVYEEFIQKENKIYSTEEQKIGKWIDGKPIYRKTIISTTFETNYYSIPSNIKQFITQYGYVQRKDYPTIFQFINSRIGTDMSIQFSESKILEGIKIEWGSNWKNNYSSMFDKIIITIEYTKTTD